MKHDNKQNLQILIIDDEQLARNYLKDTIEELYLDNKINFNITNIYDCDNFKDYLKIIDENKINLVFLDINMPFKNGIDIIKEINQEKIKKQKKTPVVCFLTAYDNYALKAYENGAIDYLLKPIINDKIISFFNKLELINLKEESKYLIINSNGINAKIDVEDIFYIKSDGKNINIYTENKMYTIQDSISRIQELYSDFLRVHRSFLINKNYISKFYKKENLTFVELKNIDYEIPVSRRQKVEIEGSLNIKLFD